MSESDSDVRIHAPELTGGSEWFNVAVPLSLRALRGKVVLLDFWTYGCVNCMHILPDLKYLEQKYGSALVVIGVHSAKFSNERQPENKRARGRHTVPARAAIPSTSSRKSQSPCR